MEAADKATKQILENLQINPWIRRVNFLGKEDFMKLESQWRGNYLRYLRKKFNHTQMDYITSPNENQSYDPLDDSTTCTIL